MGKITGAAANNFISADFIYNKIKRELRSLGAVGLVNESDFPDLTMEVLRTLGVGVMRESDEVVFLKNGEGKLPKDYYQLMAAYRVHNNDVNSCGERLLQRKVVFENENVYNTIKRSDKCTAKCCAGDDDIVRQVIYREYVNEDPNIYNFDCVGGPLKLSPNVNNGQMGSRGDEITIDRGFLFSNFTDDGIYIQYYAYPFDEKGFPMIKDSVHVEKAVEYYIKYQLFLNYWLVDDLANALNKWQKMEQLYNEAIAEAKHEAKIPAFSTMVNQLRNARGINKFQAFSKG